MSNYGGYISARVSIYTDSQTNTCQARAPQLGSHHILGPPLPKGVNYSTGQVSEQYHVDIFMYLYILAIQMKLPLEHHKQPGGREDVWNGQPETVFLCSRVTVLVVEVMVIATVK